MLEIDKIINTGNYQIVIKWKDGRSQAVEASYIESCCPCIQCAGSLKAQLCDIKFIKILPKGRLGLQFFFSKGCSQGIYSYREIRSWLKN